MLLVLLVNHLEDAKEAKNRATCWTRAAGRNELTIAHRLWIAIGIAQPLETLVDMGYGTAPKALDFAQSNRQKCK